MHSLPACLGTLRNIILQRMMMYFLRCQRPSSCQMVLLEADFLKLLFRCTFRTQSKILGQDTSQWNNTRVHQPWRVWTSHCLLPFHFKEICCLVLLVTSVHWVRLVTGPQQRPWNTACQRDRRPVLVCFCPWLSGSLACLGTQSHEMGSSLECCVGGSSESLALSAWLQSIPGWPADQAAPLGSCQSVSPELPTATRNTPLYWPLQLLQQRILKQISR